MPYAEKIAGIYRIVNTVNNKCYVGQSGNLHKRIAEHFRLLRAGAHENLHLQNSFNKYGRGAFRAEIEVVCDDIADLDPIEEAFLIGAASFDSPTVYNIASFAKAPMRGKIHTEETREKIRRTLAAKGPAWRSNPERNANVKKSLQERALSNPEYRERVKFIVSNNHLSYAERGRRIGMPTTTVRRVYLKYKNREI